MPDSQTEHDAKVAAAARLAVKRKEQKEIADILQVSQATVSRLLQEAESRKWLIRTLVYREERIPAHVKARAAERTDFKGLVDDLRRACGENLPLRSVRVFDSGWGGIPDTELPSDRRKAEMDRRLKVFGRSACGRMLELFEHIEVAGISWGATLLHAIHGLEGTCGEPLRQPNPIDFVPLCCEPLGNSSIAVSSSQLAARLNAVINGGAGPVRSFTGVPAFIPKGFTKSERETVEKLIRYVEDYAEVFPPQHLRPSRKESQRGYMCNKLQLVLTSLAPADRLLGLSEDKLMGAGFDRSQLAKAAVGDLCGTVLCRGDATPEQASLIRVCNESWTGIHLDQLRQVPDTCQDGKDGGIVVVAIGRSKVPVTLEAIKQGIHELLIDGDLASGLQDELSRREGSE